MRSSLRASGRIVFAKAGRLSNQYLKNERSPLVINLLLLNHEKGLMFF